MPCDWSKKSRALSGPIRSKIKTNCDMFALVFPRLKQITCIYIEFLLIHFVVCLLWLTKAITLVVVLPVYYHLSLFVWPSLARCLVLSVYVLRFMTLGSKINSKFTNTSGLLTEQVSVGYVTDTGFPAVWLAVLPHYTRFHGHISHLAMFSFVDQPLPPNGKSSSQERGFDNCQPCAQAGFQAS